MVGRLKLFSLLGALLLLSGCISYSYRLDHVAPELSSSGQARVAVACHDQRSYVISGEYKPQNVGVVRSTVGIPAKMSTASGKPLAQDVGEVLRKALAQKGFQASLLSTAASDSVEEVYDKLKATGAERLLYLQINQWRTDTFNNLRFENDFVLQIMDKEGAVLAETTRAGDDDLGFLFGMNLLKMTQERVAKALKEKLEQLLNDPAAERALNGAR